MCLDVDYAKKKKSIVKDSSVYEIIDESFDSNMEHADFKEMMELKSLCGGSLIEHKPIFDPKQQNIYVVRDDAKNDKIRLYSLETGEMIRELNENHDGKFVGIFLHDDSLITCTGNGKILFWNTDTYLIKKKLNLKVDSLSSTKRFLLTKYDDNIHGLVHYEDEKMQSKIALFELEQGKLVYEFNLPTITGKFKVKVRLADGDGFFVILHYTSLYIINKESNNFICHNTGVPANVITCHPQEQMIATGDQKGKIFLWNNIFDRNPAKTLLHWHHMIVLSLAFSQSGTVLYSGGSECVLVKWVIKEKALEKSFLPRVSGSIKQISIDSIRDKVTISLDDNSIQVINSNLNQLKTIQDFTLTSPYELGLSEPYKVGIRVDPKNRHLVFNGRIGHLQFFSTKSMKLLFNVDITQRNPMPRQEKCNNFSTEVTHAAFSSCGTWMATVENWNNKIHSAESRLKFWRYIKEKQTYLLHTQIEQAHEKSIIALEFSNGNESNICATAGLDRIIRIWSLEASEEIKNPKKIWMHIEELSYKNLPINSLSFSSDSSLIVGGFGNSLCVWDTKNFKLLCALSAPAVFDGSTNRAVLSLPNTTKKSNSKQLSINNLIEKRQKLLQMMKTIIDDKNTDLVKNITQEKMRYFKKKSIGTVEPKKLTINEKKLIFNQILVHRGLNLNEKLQIFHKLNIYYKISNRLEDEVINFISQQALEEAQLFKGLQRNLNDMKSEEKYKLLWRFKTWRNLDSKRNRKIVTVRKLLKKAIDENVLKKNETVNQQHSLLPIKNLANVTKTLFCSKDLSHLIVATTPSKLLIWNLLTLKLEGSYKIHVKNIIIDPLTNLIAAFTKYNQLFIIQPSPAMTIFSQKNLPDIYDMIWVPRDNPRNQSLSVNWQATSQLFFLTQRQEICGISYKSDFDDDVIEVPCIDDLNVFMSHTPFAAMISKHSEKPLEYSSVRKVMKNSSGYIKEVINLSNHAMPPARLLVKDFLASLISSEKKQTEDKNKNIINSASDDNVEVMIISDDEEDEKITLRKKAMQKEKAMEEEIKKKKEALLSVESKIKTLKLDDSFKFKL